MFAERLDEKNQRLTEENKTLNDRLQALEQQQQRPAGNGGILKEKCDEQGEFATEAGGRRSPHLNSRHGRQHHHRTDRRHCFKRSLYLPQHLSWLAGSTPYYVRG